MKLKHGFVSVVGRVVLSLSILIAPLGTASRTKFLAEGASHGQDEITHFQLLVGGPVQGRQVISLDLDHGEVRLRIVPHDLGLELTLVEQGHGHLRRIFDHVVVRHDVPILRDDDTGPRAPWTPRRRGRWW